MSQTYFYYLGFQIKWKHELEALSVEQKRQALEISSYLCLSSPLFTDMSPFPLQPGIKNTLFCTFLPFPLRILYVWKWWYWWMKAKGVHSTATAFLSVCLQMFGWAQKTGHMSNTNTVTENDLTKCFRDHNTSDLIATFWCQSLEIKEQGFPPTPLFSTDKQWQWEQYIIEEDVKFPGDSSLYRLQFSAARRQKKTRDILLRFTSYFWKTDTWTSSPRLLKRTLGNVGKC